MDSLDKYLIELLHLDEINKNKLIDLSCGDLNTYKIFCKGLESNRSCVEKIVEQMKEELDGKSDMSALYDSAIRNLDKQAKTYDNAFDWCRYDGTKPVDELNSFVNKIYKEDIIIKGNNPLFLSIGAINWNIVKDGEEDVYNVTSPLLIFPVQLVRLGEQSGIYIKYVAYDEAYINPCLYHGLIKYYGEKAVKGFPLPEGAIDVDTPIDIRKLDIEKYLLEVGEFIGKLSTTITNMGNISLDPYLVVISAYKHSDYCMYYDIRRNMDKVLNSDLVGRIFSKKERADRKEEKQPPTYIKSYDKAQDDIIKRVINGDNLVVQGPPGSGKTHTIVNMIGALMAQNKKVLFVSTKIPALAEVYKKTPENLQKYLLPLFFESEQGSKSLNPKELHDSLAKASDVTIVDDGLTGDIDRAKRQRSNALTQINEHFKYVFNTNKVLDYSLFDAFNIYYENEDISDLDFMSEYELLNLDVDGFSQALVALDSSSGYYKEVTENGKRVFCQNAWYGVLPEKKNYEKFNSEVEILNAKINKAIGELKSSLGDSDGYDDLSLNVISWATHSKINRETIETILASGDSFAECVEDASSAIKDYNAIRETLELAKKYGVKEAVDKQHEYTAVVPKATVLAIKGLAENQILNKLHNTPLFEVVLKESQEYCENLDKSLACRQDILNAFTDAVIKNEDFVKLVKKARKEFVKMTKKGKESLLCDKTVNKLKAFSYKTEISGGEIIQAISAMIKDSEYVALNCEIIKVLNDKLLLNGADVVLSELEMELISQALGEKENNAHEYLSIVKGEWQTVEPILTELGVTDYSLTCLQLESIVKANAKANEFNKLIVSIKEKLGASDYEIDNFKFGKEVLTLYEVFRFVKEEIVPENVVDEIVKILDATKTISNKTEYNDACNALWTFIQDNYNNNCYIYALTRKMSIEQFGVFVKDVKNKALFDNVSSFFEEVKKSNKINLLHFYARYIMGDRKDNEQYSFEQIFTHVVYSQKIRSLIEKDNAIRGAIDSMYSAETMLHELNAKRIEVDFKRALKSSGLVKDGSLDFLKTACKYKYLRGYFKEKADIILKLKSCLILAPSAVSILLRGAEYMDFDVAILDEASQIPPEYVLPILIRAKQCVFVGDINQMPYIKNFAAQNSGGSQDEEYVAVNSVLDLINQNESFDSIMLKCHFRSQTESLIAYSQERYYKEMLTFPAINPYSDGKGTFDVLVDGYTERTASGLSVAQNRVEAQKVIEILQNHFDKYFDAENKILTRTVGVIAFGEKQVSMIEDLIEKTPELDRKINLIRSTDEINAEKYFFIKAIQKSQGMEIDDLIISMTYGKIKDNSGNLKINPHWGDLNKSFGEKIFNVAVTRGKKSVTVIHSVHYTEVSDGLAFIRDYLRMINDFSLSAEKGEFVSRDNDNSYYDSVIRELVKLGVDKDRIVVNYGVTSNSFAIPIAILSKERDRVELGIMCERKSPNGRYVDYLVRYPNILLDRGWREKEQIRLYNLFVNDWFTNKGYEIDKLKSKLKEFGII